METINMSLAGGYDHRPDRPRLPRGLMRPRYSIRVPEILCHYASHSVAKWDRTYETTLVTVNCLFFVEGGRERTWLLQYRPHVRCISQVSVPNVREELVVRVYVSGHLGKESCKARGVYAVHTWVERGGCVTTSPFHHHSRLAAFLAGRRHPLQAFHPRRLL